MRPVSLPWKMSLRRLQKENPILPWQKDAANWLRETETHLFQPATAVLWL